MPNRPFCEDQQEGFSHSKGLLLQEASPTRLCEGRCLDEAVFVGHVQRCVLATHQIIAARPCEAEVQVVSRWPTALKVLPAGLFEIRLLACLLSCFLHGLFRERVLVPQEAVRALLGRCKAQAPQSASSMTTSCSVSPLAVISLAADK